MIHAEIDRRIGALQEALSERQWSGALIVDQIDLFYFANTDQNAHLYVPARGEPLLMVRKSLERAREHSPLRHQVPLKGFSHLLSLIREHTGRAPECVGLEMDVLPVSLFQLYERHFPGTEIQDASGLIREIRMIKSPYERSLIARAGEMADQLLEQIPAFLVESKTENDLAARAEFFYRSSGHPGAVPTRSFHIPSMYGQIMSGPRAAEPSNSAGPTGGRGLGPYLSSGASMETIGDHEPILVDYGANFQGYLCDQARIYSRGRLSDSLLRAQDVAIDIQNLLAREARPGIRTGKLYAMALEVAEKAGLLRGFMGYPDPVPFVGHGVGLELDEWPVIGKGWDIPLVPGMVIALEPKFVFPGQGVMGIENTFEVTEEGLKRFTHFPDPVRVC